MKLLHYYPRALTGDGGVTVAVRGWASAVAGLGHDIRVLHALPPRPAEEIDGVDYVGVAHAGRGPFLHPVDLDAHFEWADALILHSAWVANNAFLAREARLSGLPYVLTPHGGYEPRILSRRRATKRIWWWALERKMVRDAAAIHLFFDAERATLRRQGYPGPFVVAPTGIDLPAARLWDGGSSGDVLWYGRYDPEHKGLDLLIDALASLAPRDRPFVRLHGPDFKRGRGTVVDLVRKHELEPWVTVKGPLRGSDKFAALRSARAFVYPSRWEAQGLAVVEALAAGVPCVVTSTMRIATALKGSGAAFVAEPTPAALAEAIVEAMSSHAASVPDRARLLCRKQFAWPTVARAFVQQLDAVVAGTSP